MNKFSEEFIEKIADVIANNASTANTAENAVNFLQMTEDKLSKIPFKPYIGYQEQSFSESKYKTIERECYIKSDISRKLNGRFDDEYFNKYIVSQWGGIFIKDIKAFCEKAEAFRRDLENGECTLDCISSLSKVAAFAHPDKYFIYDSRVAYSLDWLLFKSGYDEEYFPVPESQVKAIKEYNIETVLRLSNRRICEKKSTKNVYLTYCELIQSIHGLLLKKNPKPFGQFDKKPFIVEMILYSITEKLMAEMKEKISIFLKK